MMQQRCDIPELVAITLCCRAWKTAETLSSRKHILAAPGVVAVLLNLRHKLRSKMKRVPKRTNAVTAISALLIYKTENQGQNKRVPDDEEIAASNSQRRHRPSVDSLNIDCLIKNKCRVLDYLNLLAGFGLINHIEVTREEILGELLTKSWLCHVITRHCNQKLITSVMKCKLSDNYILSHVWRYGIECTKGERAL